jgi:hypothetical protein
MSKMDLPISNRFFPNTTNVKLSASRFAESATYRKPDPTMTSLPFCRSLQNQNAVDLHVGPTKPLDAFRFRSSGHGPTDEVVFEREGLLVLQAGRTGVSQYPPPGRQDRVDRPVSRTQGAKES